VRDAPARVESGAPATGASLPVAVANAAIVAAVRHRRTVERSCEPAASPLRRGVRRSGRDCKIYLTLIPSVLATERRRVANVDSKGF